MDKIPPILRTIFVRYQSLDFMFLFCVERGPWLIPYLSLAAGGRKASTSPSRKESLGEFLSEIDRFPVSCPYDKRPVSHPRQVERKTWNRDNQDQESTALISLYSFCLVSLISEFSVYHFCLVSLISEFSLPPWSSSGRNTPSQGGNLRPSKKHSSSFLSGTKSLGRSAGLQYLR